MILNEPKAAKMIQDTFQPHLYMEPEAITQRRSRMAEGGYELS
jgi:hypothetical protein